MWRRQAQTIRHNTTSFKIGYCPQFRTFLISHKIQKGIISSKLWQFCWIGGFCLLMDLYWQGSTINRTTPHIAAINKFVFLFFFLDLNTAMPFIYWLNWCENLNFHVHLIIFSLILLPIGKRWQIVMPSGGLFIWSAPNDGMVKLQPNCIRKVIQIF